MVLNDSQIKIARLNGKIISLILKKLLRLVYKKKEGDLIDREAGKLIKEAKGTAAFKEVKNEKGELYPANICLSINEEIVHCLPFGKKIRPSDVVSLDLGFKRDNIVVDMAWTVYVEGKNKEIFNLLKANKEALYKACKKAKKGNSTLDISREIEETAKKYKVYPVKELTGHGLGYTLHEQPTIFNVVYKERSAPLEKNMLLAIEPIFANQNYKRLQFTDNWNIILEKGTIASHFEFSVLVSEEKGEILTPSP